nr:unnamed protein product [Callosobruchus analis]
MSDTFPVAWKVAKVCPVFKTGNKCNIENYRPISLINIFAKVFEIVIYNRLYPSLKSQISDHQHGFVSNRSTLTNLVILTQYISEALDDNCQVDVIYTDFSKAFDRIDHGVLLNKLGNFGLAENTVRFFRSYLSERKQFVAYNGFKSESYLTPSGVPQGSNLGPLLFLLFINDLCQNMNCKTLCFADDLKIYSSITDVQDCLNLQTQLSSIQIWCDRNKLDLNISKCKVVSYTRRKIYHVYNYNINGSALERCSTVKDLGVLYDEKLTFNSHISQKVSEALRSYGFLVRNCRQFYNIRPLKMLYFTYVHTKLEYASLIWSPYYKCHIGEIEKVQRKFMKFLFLRSEGIYPEQGISNLELCERFEIRTLEFRRKLSASVFLFKLLNGIIDCPDILQQININVPSFTSRNYLTFKPSRARTNILVKSPINVMCKCLNSISYHCDVFICSISEIVRMAYIYLE